MKKISLLTVLLLCFTPALCLAQSGRIEERVPGTERLNERVVPQPSGRYGPDPYVSHGSVSPFAKSPPIPLRSVPPGTEFNPYTASPPCGGGTLVNGECKH